MAAPSIDVQKQRYAQELAAYTLRQWTAARQSLEQKDAAPAAQPPARSRSPSRIRNVISSLAHLRL
ncbi:hypothetical protein FA95DRAFT_1603291 [Auriscalpium vulgare]|uniref:Uncharacterized protein n=1 Tax=Auriscalpium vulgare TaxID=40419 RepID=A0ACB8S4D0_9AGAM|nr:hypothetical protein FA95DRAFT_1603291 [Auriscalpium vulgare]